MATAGAVETMKAAKGTEALHEIVQREVPEPRVGQARMKAQACGVCHSDALVVEGSWPGISHEGTDCGFWQRCSRNGL
jgi:D-arabinose 1-dehydrogenase-like Zn-dependent alcohol dehydrogenase